MDVEQIRGSEQVGETSSVQRRLLQELAPRFPVMPLYRHRGDGLHEHSKTRRELVQQQ